MENKPYKGTHVSRYKSQDAIRKILHKEGIFEQQFTDLPDQIVFRFKKELDFDGKKLPMGVQIEMPIPPVSGATTEKEKNRIDKEVDRRYRVLYWMLKSKFEAIHTELFESVTVGFIKEFYPNLLFKNKYGSVQTLYQSLMPQMMEAIEGKRTELKMLPDMREEVE